MQRDEAAASPLVVIATFVAAAVFLTVVVYAVAFDRPADRLHVVGRQGDAGLEFEVTRTTGGLAWDDVDAAFIDRAGTDVADAFLTLPTGNVAAGDRIVVAPQPPAGAYVLVLQAGGAELARVVVVL